MAGAIILAAATAAALALTGLICCAVASSEFPCGTTVRTACEQLSAGPTNSQALGEMQGHAAAPGWDPALLRPQC